jgi:DNA-binding NarL/FixJ family response regulator
MSSILLVEDHKIMADTLVRVLHDRGNFNVAEVAENAEEAMQYLSGQQVDLALVDVALPRTSGIELVTMIRQKYPSLPCLMISSWDNEQYAKRALAAGARGYVLKDDIYEVIEGIHRVLEGEIYLSKHIAEEG